MDTSKTEEFVNDMWDSSIIPELCDYIRLPNKSPHFDPDWEKHGHMEQAVLQLEAWCKTQPVKGMSVEIVRIEGRTPVLFAEIPGDSDDVVLLYGHYDKQPEFSIRGNRRSGTASCTAAAARTTAMRCSVR
jgi:acetylornithine deacetylase/succinyl-diaminopimelate desuccinylase-like protein